LAITLTSVAERAHLLHAGVNLETHIADVLAELAAHNVENGVLVGHSNGGMVITAFADRVPQQVDSLVYLDALVPRDGESCWHLVNDEERQWYLDVDDTGYGVPDAVLRSARDGASAGVVSAADQTDRRPEQVPASRLRLCA
jgi:pimeloyl-ACP methyl ester carboxylesterase